MDKVKKMYEGTYLEQYEREKLAEDEEPNNPNNDLPPMNCIMAFVDDYKQKRGVLFRNDFKPIRGRAMLVPHINPELSSEDMDKIERENVKLNRTIEKTYPFLFAHLKKDYNSFMKKYSVWKGKDSLNEYYTVLKKYIDFQRELIDYILNVNNSINILKKQKSTDIVNCFTALKEQIEENKQQNEYKQWDDYFYRVVSDYLNNYNQQSSKPKPKKHRFDNIDLMFTDEYKKSDREAILAELNKHKRYSKCDLRVCLFYHLLKKYKIFHHDVFPANFCTNMNKYNEKKGIEINEYNSNAMVYNKIEDYTQKDEFIEIDNFLRSMKK